jgi:PAS domain S-box-containing protein
MAKVNTLEEIVLRDSPLAWWEWDVINNVVTMNDLKVTMLGYTLEQFHGKGYEPFTNLLHPDDVEKTMDAMRDLLTEKKNIYQIDYRIKDSSGHYHWYMDRGVVIDREEGKITRIRGIVIDLGVEHALGTNTEAIITMLSRFAADQNALIIICSSCKKVKISKEEWTSITDDMNNSIMDTLSHGICPVCVKSLYPDFAERVLNKKG